MKERQLLLIVGIKERVKRGQLNASAALAMARRWIPPAPKRLIKWLRAREESPKKR